MQSNFRYAVQGFDPIYGRIPRPLEETWRRRTGDCKDLSTMYIKLLAHFGIEAEPVFVAVDGDGPTTFIPNKFTLPSTYGFNHVIVHIPALDAYVDMTGYPDALFGTWSARYANSNAFHLFSAQLRDIKPGTYMRTVKTKTQITKKAHGWVGLTNWSGEGWGQVDVTQTGKIIRGDNTLNPTFFARQGFFLKANSWQVSADEVLGKVEMSFEYDLKKAPVDERGSLIEFPANLSVPLQNFYLSVRPSDYDACFAKERFEDDFAIESVKARSLSKEKLNVRIVSEGSEFSQRVEIGETSIRIVRTQITDEPHAHCSPSAILAKKRFYQEVAGVISETQKTLTYLE